LAADDLSLSRLRVFLVVAEELNFTRAAARLHVAQQALSATISRLERELGVRLFDRTTRAVSLTPAGEAMVRRTRHAFDELAGGVADARRIDRRGRGGLAVGVMAGAALELTDPILAACAEQLPGCTVTLDPHLYDDPSAGLHGGTSDIGILRLPLEPRGLELVRLFSEPRVATLSARHPLAHRATLTLDDVQATTVVRPTSPDPIWNEFWAAGCATTRDARTLEAMLEMVSAGQAIAISAVGWLRYYPHPGVRGVPVAGLARSEVALGWRKGDPNPLVRRFVELALATAQAHPLLLQAIEQPDRTPEGRGPPSP
jgi:DNA-binding transcriptional LysR family regulator